MSKEVKDPIESYDTCSKYKKNQIKTYLVLREIPEGPWKTWGLTCFIPKMQNGS